MCSACNVSTSRQTSKFDVVGSTLCDYRRDSAEKISEGVSLCQGIFLGWSLNYPDMEMLCQ